MGDDCGIRVIKPRSKHNLVAVRHRLSIDLYSSNHLFCRLTNRQQYLRSSMRQTHNYYKYTHLSVCFFYPILNPVYVEIVVKKTADQYINAKLAVRSKTRRAIGVELGSQHHTITEHSVF